MNTMKKSLLASTVAFFVGGGGASGVSAQEEAAQKDKGFMLEEVVVTAEKRSASLQDVPIAVTAFTGSRLAESGIEDSAALEQVTPGLVFSTNASLGQISIRGVGSPFAQGPAADPSTAVYINGVYQPRFSAAIIGFMDLERVEVLKGPQGTLYGRNATGGAINYITQKPGDEFGGKLSVQIGNYNLRRYQIQVDTPLIEDELLLRSSFMKLDRDGYFENLLIPSDNIEEDDLFSGRFSLLYMPSENLDIKINAGFSRREGGIEPGVKPINVDPMGPIGGTRIINDPRKVLADQTHNVYVENEFLDVTVNYDLGWAALTSITGYSDQALGDTMRDIDGTEIPVLHQGQLGVANGPYSDSESFSQEVFLTSNNSDQLSWVMGLYYFQDNPYTKLGIDSRVFNFFGEGESQNDTKAYAAYGSFTYSLTEKVEVTAGVRLSEEEKTITLNQSTSPDSGSDSWSSVTPKLGVNYFVNSDVMLYASASRGFKSGSFNSVTNEISGVDPENLDAYELGVKSELLGGRLRFNATAFVYDFTDMQVQSLNPSDPANTILQNAGEADMSGLEVEVVGILTENFQVDLGMAWLDTEYSEFDIPGGSLEGNSLPISPEFTSNLGLSYWHDMADWGVIKFRGDYYYSAEMFQNELNTIPLEEHSLVNLRVTLEPYEGEWSLALYGKNVTDELVQDSTFESSTFYGSGYVETYLPPRTYGVEVKLNF